MSQQTLRQRTAISAFLRKSSRPRMDNVRACADENGTIQLRPKLLCDPDLPGWLPIFKTLIS